MDSLVYSNFSPVTKMEPTKLANFKRGSLNTMTELENCCYASHIHKLAFRAQVVAFHRCDIIGSRMKERAAAAEKVIEAIESVKAFQFTLGAALGSSNRR